MNRRKLLKIIGLSAVGVQVPFLPEVAKPKFIGPTIIPEWNAEIVGNLELAERPSWDDDKADPIKDINNAIDKIKNETKVKFHEMKYPSLHGTFDPKTGKTKTWYQL